MNRRHFLAGSAIGIAVGVGGYLALNRRPRIHLFGDSISVGFALKKLAPEVEQDHPLYKLRSISSIANPLLEENSSAWRVDAITSLLPEAEKSVTLIHSLFAQRTINPGDIVVVEDAGGHNRNPDEYQKGMKAIRLAITGKHDVTCLMMTMFDYVSELNLCGGTTCRWNVVQPGYTRSMNDATTAAAMADLPTVGRTQLLDMRSRMNEWQTYSAKTYGIPVMFNDGIHPNVWGQMLILGEIFAALGFTSQIKTLNNVQRTVAENWKILGFDTTFPGWNAEQAVAYARQCLIRPEQTATG